MKYKIKGKLTNAGFRYFPMKRRFFRWRYLGRNSGKIIPNRTGWVRASFDIKIAAKRWLKEILFEKYVNED